MYSRLYSTPPSLDLALLTSFLVLAPLCSSTQLKARAPALTVYSNYFDPAPSPEDGPPLSANAIRNPAYLPAHIGAIVGSYALSLVVVASILLLLAKKRRSRLTAGEAGLDTYEEYGFQFAFPPGQNLGDKTQNHPYPYPSQAPKSPIHNFSYPTPHTPSAEQGQNPYTFSGSFSTYSTSTLGINPLVDQRVVAADREMAQSQLEEMYKYVMEHEAAKEAGTPIEAPPTPLAGRFPNVASPKQSIPKKSKGKPANLNLSQGEPERQSRTSSILSVLKSPRKKGLKGFSISSPIMTPMSGTFPRQDGEEMNAIPPRHYAPASPPPIPTDQPAYLPSSRHQAPVAPVTPPDMSPESTQSIDERLGAQFGHSRYDSQTPTEVDPISATSERSTAPLIGLPNSPKPNATRFPSLPTSPKPGATFPASPRSGQFPASPRSGQSFSRPNAPSAVRTGGTLPLRAYEPALSSPSAQTTKQTTFERTIPLSPGMRTPWTGAPVPYTPYQPFSPVIPVTPSLVTKADRKRMKQLQPKTPTMQMVQDTDDVW
ncbi:putative RNA polymerase ii transcription initiation nucleotide excision repair factor tfiih [Rosellinia necatrix]|uniref:Putative RNA polymerase ii transcription initiation nucleotide excision repair factor tfiih n=1 Tax=Rosellinia necatrix TaxID=77044 RepID=A0A1W2TJK1_ROSNE|nr:putative RNA polymerase ii transcription initiation nucleotide excision repair factor tfiih [Rosellinia necatrix]